MGDFNGDGKLDLGVFRSSTNYWYAETTAGTSILSVQFGLSTDLLVPGDYDGDGFTDLAVYRPSTLGFWYIDTNRDGTPNISVQFGTSGDIPVPGDYNGDGKMDLAVFRPSTGYWYISTNQDGIADITVQFGTNGDKPVQADYDGDGKTDVAVFRPSTGYWYFKLSGDSSSPSVQWGASTDKLAPADYDADGKTDVAVFRPSDGRWYIIKSANGASISPQWGTSGDIPTPGAALSGLGLQRIKPLATEETDASALADPHPMTRARSDRPSPLSPKSVVPEPQRRYFFYSPEMNLIAESELTSAATPVISYEYIWFNGHPVAQIDLPSTTHWTFTDHLGTPLIQTTDSQIVYWRAEYEPYGKVFSLWTTDQHQPLRLPGQEAEELNTSTDGNGATERSYNIFRWYRPSWGRYTQPDPLGLDASIDLYSYADDNSILFIDPTGTVDFQIGPTTDHAVDGATLRRMCQQPAFGCTIPHFFVDCKCVHEQCHWIPRVTVRLLGQDVYYPYTAQPLVRSEEEKHVIYNRSLAKALFRQGERLETARFAGRPPCDIACRQFMAEAGRRIAAASEDVHRTSPHPF